MPGVKGRSGRKSIAEEQKRRDIINLAWQITEDYLKDQTIERKEKIELVCRIITKDMPEKLTDGDGNSLPRPIINIFGSRISSDRLLPAVESDPSLTSNE